MTTNLNKRERKAQQLIAHYDRCAALARHLGMTDPDGKKISVALFKLERLAHQATEHACSYPEKFTCNIGQPFGVVSYDFANDENAMDEFCTMIAQRVVAIFGKLPPGFFVNSDPRGYALKIDNEERDGKRLIEALKLHTDWGGNGILSPEITGN